MLEARDGSDIRIYVCGIDGSDLKDLGPGLGPSWSPDDKQIAFAIPLKGLGAKSGVWVMNSEGAGREWLVDGWGPAWSPDGKRIAFCDRQDGLATLSLLDTTDGSTVRLFEPTYKMVLRCSWSPDGKRLVFGSQSAINIVNAERSATVHVRAEGGLYFHPAWSPDGSQIMFTVQGADNLERFHVVDPDTADLPVVLNGQDGWEENDEAAWSPDGKKVAFTSVADR